MTAEKEIKKITGLNFASSDLMTKWPASLWWPPPYEYVFPPAATIVPIVGVGYVIIVFLFIKVRRILRLHHSIH
jgi:hypothetical protein